MKQRIELYLILGISYVYIYIYIYGSVICLAICRRKCSVHKMDKP